MSKENLKEYQQEIIHVIKEKISKNNKEIFIQMAPGTGKSSIIRNLALELEGDILILTSCEMLTQQYKNTLEKSKNIKIKNYHYNIETSKKFEYVIIDDAQNVSEETYQCICEDFKNAILISFCDTNQIIGKEGMWLNKKSMDYYLTTKMLIDRGYINPCQEEKIVSFIEHLFKHLKFTNIGKEVPIKSEKIELRTDLVTEKNGKRIIVEVKNYRSQFVQNDIINRAIEQVQYYGQLWKKLREKQIITILVVSSQISNEIKEKYYKEKEVLILDIANLLYLTQISEELQKELIEIIQYDISKIIPIPPLFLELFQIQESKEKNETIEIIEKATALISQVETMKAGKDEGQDKKYQKLGIEIIRFLFETEFTRMSEESKTEDNMFRMDLICGLKGTSAFWKIFMQHYNTRFVVFEFKNYKDEINQNLVYITEKYLYDAALRNVAVIISRKGFSQNACKAAKAALTEHGKLILDIKDVDLITMLRMKADGQDPSDYMLNKLEEYLMSISK